MQGVVQRVLDTFGMMNTMPPEKVEQTRQLLLDFLAKRPDDDEHTATVESLIFLKNLKT
jgi:hypothetical protein